MTGFKTVVFFIIIIFLSACSQKPLYKDAEQDVESRVEDLLKRNCHIASGGAIGADEYCYN